MKKLLSRILVVVMIAGLIGAVPVQAASINGGIVFLSTQINDKYTKADVTGDGKADTVTTKVTGTKVTLSVNSTVVKTWQTSSSVPTVKILRYADGKAYIEITTENFTKGLTSGGIYKVADGALKCMLNYNSLIKTTLLGRDAYVTDGINLDLLCATKLKNDVLYIQAALGTKSLGQIKVTNLKINYVNGKFSLAKNPGTLSFTVIDRTKGVRQTFMRAKKELTVYKKAASSVKASFSIAKSAQFTPLKAAIISKNIYVYIKDASDNYGWIKLGTSQFVREKAELIYG